MSKHIDISHIARLARLNLDDQERERAHAQLRNIIAMIDTMQAVDTDGVEPMAHPHDATQRLRADVVTETVDVAKFQAHAPSTEAGYYLVPRVVE